MIKLIVQLPLKEPQEFPLTGNKIVIGRAPDNEIIIDEKIVSRKHAEIVREGERYILVDLDSHNGTFINDARVSRHVLADQDTIRIGTATIKFIDQISTQVSLSDDHIQDENRTLVKSLAEENVISPLRNLARIIDTPTVQDEQASISRQALAATLRFAKDRPSENLEKNYRNLLILYQIGETINSVTNLEDLLEVIMELVIQVVEAERGFLLLRDIDTSILVPKVIRYRGVSTPEEKISLSRTIVSRVMEEQVAVLTADAKVDARFKAGESIQLYGIRSAMCVPLWRHRDDIIGVLFLDRTSTDKPFTEDDLDLLFAIGNQAAIGIQQSRLQEKIRQESQIRNNLMRFHSPSVVDMLMKQSYQAGGITLETQEQKVTILFSDIIGFTKIAERLQPTEVAQLLNDYFSRMTDIVFEYDGTLDKYIGDGIMAVFGAPFTRKDDAKRAVLAAKKMLLEREQFMEELPPEQRFSIRVGINTGMVVVGNIGSIRRLDYTVLGDVVNVAARLEELAQPNQILIGPETYQEVKDIFTTESVGKKSLKGRETEIEIFQVI